MVMKYLNNILFVVVFFSVQVQAQNWTWKREQSYANNHIKVWNVNPINQVIFTSGGSIYKLDTNFKVMFTQSDKDFGAISKIDASHSLKTLVFSEDQQMVGVLDNTLTFQEGKLDLSQIDVGYATQVCYSNQSRRFWIYDEVNSRLIRVEGVNASSVQSEISNLQGMIHESSSPIIEENNHQLFLFYPGSGLYIFDYYGSLYRKIEDKKAIAMEATANAVFFLRPDVIIRINRTTGDKEEIHLPIQGVSDFRINGKAVYLKNNKGIEKYFLIRKQ